MDNIPGARTFRNVSEKQLSLTGAESLISSHVEQLQASGNIDVSQSTIQKMMANGSISVTDSTISHLNVNGSISITKSKITELTGHGAVTCNACTGTTFTIYGSIAIKDKSAIKEVNIHQQKGSEATQPLANVVQSSVSTINVYEDKAITPHIHISKPQTKTSVTFHKQSGIVKTTAPDMITVANGEVQKLT